MKITKSYLKQLIKEELEKFQTEGVLSEVGYKIGGGYDEKEELTQESQTYSDLRDKLELKLQQKLSTRAFDMAPVDDIINSNIPDVSVLKDPQAYKEILQKIIDEVNSYM